MTPFRCEVSVVTLFLSNALNLTLSQWVICVYWCIYSKANDADRAWHRGDYIPRYYVAPANVVNNRSSSIPQSVYRPGNYLLVTKEAYLVPKTACLKSKGVI